MKICVNARFLNKPFTGIGQYTFNLFKELSSITPENEYVLVVPEKVEDGMKEKFPKNVRFEVLRERKMGTAGMKKTWWEQISVPEFIEKEKADVAFFPYPSNPWTKDWYKKGIKTVVTIHDCIPWMEKKYRSGLMSKMFHRQTKKACSLADVVFTVSKSSKKDIEKVCGVDAGRISVVYNDAGDVYGESVGGESVGGDFADEVLGGFQLEKGRYFLYVGGYDERKNVEYLVEEYEKFCRSWAGGEGDSEVVPLVLVGGKLLKGKLYSSFDKSNVSEGNVVKTGFMDEGELAVLYANCAAFVHLSKKEGFNIPLLEAANCGAPLILSDIDVHREIARDSALFVDVEERGHAEAAFLKMLDGDIREKFSKKSLDLAKDYSWKNSAQKVKDVLFSK